MKNKSAMPSFAAPTLPIRWLLALTAGVLLVHIWLLQASPLALGLSQPQALGTLTTRTIEFKPTPAPIAVKAAPKRTKRPKPARVPPAQQLQSITPNPPGDLAPQPPVEEVASDATPDPVAEAPEQAAVAPPPAAPPRDQTLAVSSYSVPGSVRLKYKVETNKFPYSASADLLWKQDGERYEALLELSVFAQSRVQTSRGQVTSEGLAPIRFSDKFRSEVAAHFNREQGKVTFSANTPDAPLLAGAQDRLSVLIQVAAMIAGDPGHYPQATTLTLQTIGPRNADTWLFTVGQQEKLSLPGGDLDTLKLQRNPRQEYDQTVELWLAPALGYLPARIRITESNGDFVDQQWSSTEPAN